MSWEVLLNKRSTTWKQLNHARKEPLDQSVTIELMLENSTLIKHPVLVFQDQVLVGFNTALYKGL